MSTDSLLNIADQFNETMEMLRFFLLFEESHFLNTLKHQNYQNSYKKRETECIIKQATKEIKKSSLGIPTSPYNQALKALEQTITMHSCSDSLVSTPGFITAIVISEVFEILGRQRL